MESIFTDLAAQLSPGFLVEVVVTFIIVIAIVFVFKSDLIRPEENRPDPNDEKRRRALEILKRSAQRTREEKELKSKLKSKGRG